MESAGGGMESERSDEWNQADEHAAPEGLMPYHSRCEWIPFRRAATDAIPSLLRRLGYKKRVALFMPGFYLVPLKYSYSYDSPAARQSIDSTIA